MESVSKLKSLDDYDKYMSAEILDPNKYPRLHDIVIKHMMHRLCGVLNRECPCMVDGACHFRYPRQFSETAQQGKDTYPIYRRRQDGQKVEVRGEEFERILMSPRGGVNRRVLKITT
jgi:hypothetical protein